MTELVVDPVRRQRLAFSRDGGVLHAEVFADPGGDVPSHYHPAQEERFEVLAGRVRFDVDGRRIEGGPGMRVIAPAGAVPVPRATGTGSRTGTNAHGRPGSARTACGLDRLESREIPAREGPSPSRLPERP